MKRVTLVLCSLLGFGVVAAQMTGGMSGGMTGGMSGGMTGGMSGGMAEGMTSASAEVTLAGDQEVPAVTTEAMGSATVSLSGDTLSVSGDFSGLSSPQVGGHIHMAPAGENGDVIFPLNISADDDGLSGIFSLSTTLTPEQLSALNAGELYINIHSEMNSGGEIRGQIAWGM